MGRDGQEVPHALQCVTSVFVSTSQPLVGLLSQSPKPVSQDATAQRPIVHLGVALGVVQAAPHVPQWSSSALRSVSQPLSLMPSQSAKPASQVNWQRPDEHDVRAFVQVGQSVPHEPQCVASVRVFTSQPFPVTRSQSS